MKKLSILLLAVIALLFVGMYNAPTAQANLGQNTDLNVTVVEGKGLVNRTNQKLNVPHGFGSKVSVDISGLVNSEKGFAYYILNGEKIDTESVNLTLSGSTNLVIVMAAAGEKAVSYVDTNGELLDVDYVTDGEPVFTGVNPVKPGFNFTGFSGSYEDNHAVYTAQYSRVNQTVINVSVTGGTKDLTEVKYNDVVTLTPDAGNFSYWADMDGQVISRNPNYAFSALNDVQIKAVFNEAVNTDPVIYLSNVTGITPNAKSFLGYIEGDFVEYGVLASNKEEVLTLDTLGVTVIPSQALNPETNEFLRSIPETEDLKSFRAYAKLADGGVVYSENNFFIQGEMIGNSFTETFDGMTLSGSSYISGSHSGANSQVWSYTDARGDIALDGKALLLRAGSLTTTLDNGLSSLSFDYNRAFTGTGARSYEIYINGSLIDTVIVNATKDEILTYTNNTLNYEGTVELEIKGIGAQKVIDNLKWTEASAPGTNSRLYEVILNNDGEVSKQSIIKGSNLDLSNLPQKEGHRFIGWFDEIDNLVDGTTPIIKHMILTTKFEIGHYTLTFDSNGGTPVAPITGDYATDIVAPTAPTKEGYTFEGWNPILPSTMPSADTTYTAVWKAIDYEITFDSLGGTPVQSITAGYQIMVDKPADPEKSGYVFMGWIDENLNLVVWPYQMPLEGMNLTAQWQIVQDYTVSFNVNFEGLDNPDNQTVTLGELVVIPAVIEPEGYDLTGWAIEGVEPQTLWNFESDVVTSNMTLVAIWEDEITLVFASDLIISTYIEGASNDKAIEIYNGTGNTINLLSYNLKVAANGGNWGSAINLTGSLEHGKSFVIVHSSANATLKSFADLTSGSLTHNGDDAIGLFKGTTLIDHFGTQGTDPGSGWTIDGISNATVDHVIIRKPDVVNPKTSWDTTEWIIKEVNYYSELKNHISITNPQ